MSPSANDNYINFHLTAIPMSGDTDEMGFWAFSRHLAALEPGFDDDAPTIALRPLGAAPAAP